MKANDNLTSTFTYSFTSIKKPNEIFGSLLDITSWWNDLYNETITGKSNKPGYEFSFKAGDGAHYSKQRLIKREPIKKLFGWS